ncbi:hypothetical protein PAXRUDRAFT_833565, partial [Paxillus rubicundulus Ve08.2h10]
MSSPSPMPTLVCFKPISIHQPTFKPPIPLALVLIHSKSARFQHVLYPFSISGAIPCISL